MRKVKNPRQKPLFDPFKSILSPVALRRIQQGWQGVFRHVILQLMPVETIGQEFSPDTGTPTKELYSMAGLLLIKEFMDWTTTRAAEAYMFDASVQYALNLEPCGQSMSERTIERYERIFVENDLAAVTMDRVTGELIEALDLDVSRQRLDSTHVFSDMALFGRTRLMGVTIKRFLTQVKRHDAEGFASLPEALRARYAPSKGRLFGDVAKDSASRCRLRGEVAEDMRLLIERFADDASMHGRQTYKDLLRVFGEQCEVVESRVEVRAHPGNEVMQNPSDPDATRDGHKGPGYQAQITETCSEANEAQLATAVIPQTAAEDDRNAMGEVLEHLEAKGLLPETLYADTHYGSDASERQCAGKGVDLQAPVARGKAAKPQGALSIDDFVVDEASEIIERCPAGHAPLASQHDAESGKTRTDMPAEACGSCAFFEKCPARRVRDGYRVTHTAKERRLAARRGEQATDAFKANYRIRAGIESTNSGVKRRTGLGRLRCRGAPRVFHKIVMKVCGWNVLRAAATETVRRLVAEIMEPWGHGAPIGAFSREFHRIKRRLSLRSPFSPGSKLPALRQARSLAA